MRKFTHLLIILKGASRITEEGTPCCTLHTTAEKNIERSSKRERSLSCPVSNYYYVQRRSQLILSVLRGFCGIVKRKGPRIKAWKAFVRRGRGYRAKPD